MKSKKKIKEQNKKKFIIFIPFFIIFFTAVWMNAHAQEQSVYQGLPSAPCMDPTKPIVQQYAVSIALYNGFKEERLSPTIGHDPGNCLRVLSTNDTSGRVFVRTNDTKQFTLNDFFEVWHKNFLFPSFKDQTFSSAPTIIVSVNGKRVKTQGDTPLKQGETISVSYWRDTAKTQ